MDKRELIADMKSTVKGAAFINKTQIAKFLGRSRSYVPSLVDGLECLAPDKPEGKRKTDTYYIPDVAQRILERKVL